MTPEETQAKRALGAKFIVERMKKLGWSFRLTISAHGDVAEAVFYKELTDLKEIAININPYEAIIQAAQATGELE